MDDVDSLLNDLDAIENSTSKSNTFNGYKSQRAQAQISNSSIPSGFSVFPRPPADSHPSSQYTNPKNKFACAQEKPVPSSGAAQKVTAASSDFSIDDLLGALEDSPVKPSVASKPIMTLTPTSSSVPPIQNSFQQHKFGGGGNRSGNSSTSNSTTVSPAPKAQFGVNQHQSHFFGRTGSTDSGGGSTPHSAPVSAPQSTLTTPRSAMHSTHSSVAGTPSTLISAGGGGGGGGGRCMRVMLSANHSDGYIWGHKASTFTKAACNNLRCMSCNFQVLIFSHSAWRGGSALQSGAPGPAEVDYMFFRNNMPNAGKLQAGLVAVGGPGMGQGSSHASAGCGGGEPRESAADVDFDADEEEIGGAWGGNAGSGRSRGVVGGSGSGSGRIGGYGSSNGRMPLGNYNSSGSGSCGGSGSRPSSGSFRLSNAALSSASAVTSTAYCCQCSWITVQTSTCGGSGEVELAQAPGGMVEGASGTPRWICAGH